MSQFLVELHPRRENDPVLTLPLNITRAKQLENEPNSHKWNAFTEEVKGIKDKDIFRLFTPETLRLYNWTGKDKYSMQTSDLFLVIKREWFAGNAEEMKIFIQHILKKLSSRQYARSHKKCNSSNKDLFADDDDKDE